MNKNEFIDEIVNKTGLSKKDAKNAVDAVLDTITETLVKRESVSFIGFGTFTTAERAERVGKVPGTDRKITIPATTVPKLKIGKALKDAVGKK